MLLGSTYRVSVELTKPVRDICLPAETDRVIYRLFLKGERIRVVELPAAGALAGRRIVEAAAEGRARQLFRGAMTPRRSVTFGLKVLWGLLRRRMLGLMYGVVAAKTKHRAAAARQLKQEVVVMAKAKLLEVFAPDPGMAAREAKRQWQDHVDFASAAGRAHARNGARTKSHVTDNWWERLFALPDPCAYESEYE